MLYLKTKILPLLITTEEALVRVLGTGSKVLYIDGPLHLQLADRITDLMSAHGYTASATPGKNGFFYLKTAGDDVYDPNIHSIYDPYDSL